MTVCARCDSDKEPAEFYAKDRTCKECRKSMVRANRAANVEHYRAYDRQRASRQDRVAARAAYQATEEGRLASNRAKRAYIDRDPVRRAAHRAVRNAVRAGVLVAPPVCLNLECIKPGPVEAHHTAYDHPLGVDWLCASCHKAVHRQHREWEKNKQWEITK